MTLPLSSGSAPPFALCFSLAGNNSQQQQGCLGGSRIDVPAQVCEFLVDALQGHCDEVRCVVVVVCESVLDRLFAVGYQGCVLAGFLYGQQPGWNAGEKDGWGGHSEQETGLLCKGEEEPEAAVHARRKGLNGRDESVDSGLGLRWVGEQTKKQVFEVVG